MSAICKPSDVNVDDITYGTPKKMDNGGTSIQLYHRGKPFVMQIPMMFAPYGMSVYPNDKGGDRHVLDLSFEGNPAFKDLMTKLDDKLVSDGLVYCKTWFKKTYTNLDVVKALYFNCVKYYREKDTGEISDKYPPTMRFTVPNKAGEITCEVFDASRNAVNIKEIETKRAQIAAIVQCTGIWQAGGKYGCSFKILQMKISPKDKIIGYAFVEDSDDEMN